MKKVILLILILITIFMTAAVMWRTRMQQRSSQFGEYQDYAGNFDIPVLDPAPIVRMLRESGNAHFMELPSYFKVRDSGYINREMDCT